MVVSGVPEAKKVHAQPIAKFAIDMIKEASNVKSPATGKPLQVSNFKRVYFFTLLLTYIGLYIYIYNSYHLIVLFLSLLCF